MGPAKVNAEIEETDCGCIAAVAARAKGLHRPGGAIRRNVRRHRRE
jgi:hypothetical protein